MILPRECFLKNSTEQMIICSKLRNSLPKLGGFHLVTGRTLHHVPPATPTEPQRQQAIEPKGYGLIIAII